MNYIKDTINLSVGTVDEKREEIKNYFLQTYETDEKLFDLLKDKDRITSYNVCYTKLLREDVIVLTWDSNSGVGNLCLSSSNIEVIVTGISATTVTLSFIR